MDGTLVDGLAVDTRTPKPDCMAWTEAKHSERPFSGTPKREAKPGEHTHINDWEI
jgi:hypothetical protein